MRVRNTLGFYDANSGRLPTVEGIELYPYSYVQKSKVYGDLVMVVEFPVMEMGQQSNGQVFLISLKDFTLQKKTVLKEIYFDEVLFGEGLADIYFIDSGGYTESQVYQLDEKQERAVKSAVSLSDLRERFNYYPRTEPVTVQSENGKFKARAILGRKNGDSVEVEVSRDAGASWHKKTFGLGEAEYIPFPNWPSEAIISEIQFDVKYPQILWVATNRGLVAYNFQSEAEKLYTTQNGLVENNISSLYNTSTPYGVKGISGGKYLILQHPLGVYLYERPNFK